MIAWKLWTSVPTIALWEAVALLLDIDPNELRPSSDNWLSGGGSGPWFVSSSFPSRTKELAFDKAMDFAQRAATPEGPIYLRKGGTGHKRTAQVSLAEVVAFFVHCEWKDIPAPLMQLAGSIASTTEAPNPEQLLDANPTSVSADVVSGTESSRHHLGALNAAEADSVVSVDEIGPLPLTTGEVASCFAGMRWKTAEKWKKPLGDKPKWLGVCIAIPGRRGKSETRWDPVRIGAALVHRRHAKPNQMRAKFQTMPLLKPWLEAWKTYEADYIDTE
jgi:hypothetical protein